jgi:hypothetical protein
VLVATRLTPDHERFPEKVEAGTRNGESLMSIDTSGGHSAMDYREHVRTYNGFLKGTVALIVLVIAVLLFMVVTLL